MGSLLVVDGAKGIELQLQVWNRFGGSLAGEKELEGLSRSPFGGCCVA